MIAYHFADGSYPYYNYLAWAWHIKAQGLRVLLGVNSDELFESPHKRVTQNNDVRGACPIILGGHENSCYEISNNFVINH